MRTEFHVVVYRSNVWEVKVITFSLGRGMEHGPILYSHVTSQTEVFAYINSAWAELRGGV